MMPTTLFDAHIERISAGERLSADEVRELARTPDILPLGMLADALRRRLHGNRTTFLRVATVRVRSVDCRCLSLLPRASSG
jgi:2-iminoacetate synthase ThiH